MLFLFDVLRRRLAAFLHLEADLRDNFRVFYSLSIKKKDESFTEIEELFDLLLTVRAHYRIYFNMMNSDAVDDALSEFLKRSAAERTSERFFAFM